MIEKFTIQEIRESRLGGKPYFMLKALKDEKFAYLPVNTNIGRDLASQFDIKEGDLFGDINNKIKGKEVQLEGEWSRDGLRFLRDQFLFKGLTK